MSSYSRLTESQRQRQVETHRIWVENNMERAIEWRQNYYQSNKEAISARSKKWREDNKERYRTLQREAARRRKAKKLAEAEAAKFQTEGVDAKSVASNADILTENPGTTNIE